jgi:hypothetical protein
VDICSDKIVGRPVYEYRDGQNGANGVSRLVKVIISRIRVRFRVRDVNISYTTMSLGPFCPSLYSYTHAVTLRNSG